MEKDSSRVFYRTDVTFDEYNFRLSPEKPAEREVEAPIIEMNVGSSGRRASQPARVPAEETARQPMDPEAVAAPRVREPEPDAEHSKPIRDRKQKTEWKSN